jgi:hypothetical protein
MFAESKCLFALLIGMTKFWLTGYNRYAVKHLPGNERAGDFSMLGQ